VEDEKNSPEQIESFSDAAEAATADVLGQESEEAGETPDAEPETSAPDEKPENEKGEAEGDESATESSETSEPEGSDETADEEPGEDVEGDEGPIPYERFKEVVEEKNEAKEQLEQTQSSFQQLQRQLNYYLNTEEGKQDLVEYLQDEGYLDGEQSPNTTDTNDDAPQTDQERVDKSLEHLREVLPAKAVEELEAYIQQNVGSVEEKVEKTEQKELKQQRAKAIQDRMDAMAESDDYEFFDELAHQPAKDGVNHTWYQAVVSENPQYWIDETGMVKPEKLNELHQLALVKSGKQQELIEKAKEEGKEKGKEELQQEFQKDQHEQPLAPATSNDNVSEEIPEKPSLREALELAKKDAVAG